MPPATFESLFSSAANSAFGVAMRLTRNQADAEDLVQEAALLAYRAFDSFEAGYQLPGLVSQDPDQLLLLEADAGEEPAGHLRPG